MLTLANIVNECNNVFYIELKDAEEFVSKNKDYIISDMFHKDHSAYGRKGLYKITKDKYGQCGDFMYVIPSEKDLEDIDNINILKEVI